MASILGIEGTCYKRGYFGETFPKWGIKPGPLWNWYKLGKEDRKKGNPCKCTWFTVEERKKYNIKSDEEGPAFGSEA